MVVESRVLTRLFGLRTEVQLFLSKSSFHYKNYTLYSSWLALTRLIEINAGRQ